MCRFSQYWYKQTHRHLPTHWLLTISRSYNTYLSITSFCSIMSVSTMHARHVHMTIFYLMKTSFLAYIPENLKIDLHFPASLNFNPDLKLSQFKDLVLYTTWKFHKHCLKISSCFLTQKNCLNQALRFSQSLKNIIFSKNYTYYHRYNWPRVTSTRNTMKNHDKPQKN